MLSTLKPLRDTTLALSLSRCFNCVGVCKHTVALACTNMIKSGERYAYALYLMVGEAIPNGLEFVHIDINCMHTKWRSSTFAAVEESTDPRVLNHPAREMVVQAQEHNNEVLLCVGLCERGDGFEKKKLNGI